MVRLYSFPIRVDFESVGRASLASLSRVCRGWSEEGRRRPVRLHRPHDRTFSKDPSTLHCPYTVAYEGLKGGPVRSLDTVKHQPQKPQPYFTELDVVVSSSHDPGNLRKGALLSYVF